MLIEQIILFELREPGPPGRTCILRKNATEARFGTRC